MRDHPKTAMDQAKMSLNVKHRSTLSGAVVATTGRAVCCGLVRLRAENSSKNPRFCKPFEDNGLIRKPLLYPAELRAHGPGDAAF